MMSISPAGQIALEVVSCPRCESAKHEVLLTAKDYLYHIPGEYSVSACCGCGLWYQNPRPTQDSLSLLYPSGYGPHISADGSVMRSTVRAGGIRRWVGRAVHVLKMIHPIRWQHYRTSLEPDLVDGGRLLEIGCASGARLASLRQKGWRHLHGIELSLAATQRAREQGFDVHCGAVEDILNKMPDGHFDAIVSSMVLEHLQNPFSVVRTVASKLKPRGQFLFSTIVHDTLDARIYGKYWAGFDLPRHMIFFTKKDIASMLHGIFGEMMFRHQVAPVDYVRSSSWRIRDGKGRPFDRMVLILGESLVAQILALGLAWAGNSCRVSVYCRKS